MHSRTREKQAWHDAIRRCHSPKAPTYQQFAAKEITVCPQWRQSYRVFLEDMGRAPKDRPWLGSLDVTKGYFPGNCVWTTRDEQVNRRAFCRRVEINGQVLTSAQAARLPGQPCRVTILKRQANGLLPLGAVAKVMDPRPTWLTYAGETLPLPEWARRRGIGLETLRRRIKAGWPLERAMNPASRPPLTPPPAP